MSTNWEVPPLPFDKCQREVRIRQSLINALDTLQAEIDTLTTLVATLTTAYVAKIPIGGIAARSSTTITSAVCDIYTRTTTTLVSASLTKTVWNPLAAALAAGDYVPVVEDVYGDYWATDADTTAELQANIDALSATVSALSATVAAITGLPSQTGNSGKYLTTDGSAASWATVTVALTVVEVDGSPSVANTTQISFDQADGFVVSGSGGLARVDMQAAGAAQVGIVTADTQTFGGDKTFNGAVYCGSTLNVANGAYVVGEVVSGAIAGTYVKFANSSTWITWSNDGGTTTVSFEPDVTNHIINLVGNADCYYAVQRGAATRVGIDRTVTPSDLVTMTMYFASGLLWDIA